MEMDSNARYRSVATNMTYKRHKTRKVIRVRLHYIATFTHGCTHLSVHQSVARRLTSNITPYQHQKVNSDSYRAPPR